MFIFQIMEYVCVLSMLILVATVTGQQFSGTQQPNMQQTNFNNQQTGFNPQQGSNIQPTNQQQPTQFNNNVNTNAGQADTGTANLSPEEQSQVACAQAGRMAVSQCFQSNGNFQMNVVIGLLSNGTQGTLPENADQIRDNLCQMQAQIFGCIFDSIRRFNGSQQCNTIAAFIRLEQETVGLLSGIQQMCGTGLMPEVTPCMQRLNYDIMQCYNQVGLNADLFSPRASRMEGAIIGDNREVANMFCGKRKELFACQRQVLEKCPNAKILQEMSGSDQISAQNGMDTLCKDVDVYITGLVCFQTPSREVQTCANSLVRKMTEVTITQLRDNLSPDAFYTEYCRVRLSNLKCDVDAWGKLCKPAAVGLKAEYQCNLLPSRCLNYPEIREIYDLTCREENFARKLRGTDSGAGTVTFGISLISTAIAFLFIL